VQQIGVRLDNMYWIIAAALWTAQIVPPGKVTVPADEKPSQPFVWSERRLLTAPELFDAPDEWISRSLQWTDFILERYAPSIPEHPLRRAALIRLDDVLHLESAPRNPIVQKYFQNRMNRIAAEIENTEITSGMRVWKLYNHSFFIRTPSVSFVFDLVPGARQPGFQMSKETLARIAAQADAAFISHLHDDHANRDVARMFLAAGKPVVASEGLWKNEPEFASKLIYPKRSTSEVHKIPVRGGKTLEVVAYPGHQGPSVNNNVHLVITHEGYSAMQTGDQWWDEDVAGSDFDWFAHVSRDHKVDVFLPNCWAKGLDRMVRGVNPAVVITGHENEMGHTVDHREDFTQTYTRLHGVPYPLVLMAWGEGWHYERVAR
jgi:L-ascorbate metabolism protein UlaG (beta-lactamase superfamily)